MITKCDNFIDRLLALPLNYYIDRIMKRNHTPNNYIARNTFSSGYSQQTRRPKSYASRKPRSFLESSKSPMANKTSYLTKHENSKRLMQNKTAMPSGFDRHNNISPSFNRHPLDISKSKSPLRNYIRGNGDLSFKTIRDNFKRQKSLTPSRRIEDGRVYKHLGKYFDQPLNSYAIEQLKLIHKDKIVEDLLDKEENLLSKHKSVLAELDHLDKEGYDIVNTKSSDKRTLCEDLNSVLQEQSGLIDELMVVLQLYREIFEEEKDFSKHYLNEQIS